MMSNTPWATVPRPAMAMWMSVVWEAALFDSFSDKATFQRKSASLAAPSAALYAQRVLFAGSQANRLRQTISGHVARQKTAVCCHNGRCARHPYFLSQFILSVNRV